MQLTTRLALGLSAALALLCAAVEPSIAAPTIEVGYHPLPVSTTATFDLYVTGLNGSPTTGGPDSISGIDFFVSVGTGALVAPPGEVRIVSVDIVTGTIFAGNSTSPAPGTVLAAYDQIWQIDGTTAGLPNFLVHDGKIATITLDTSGVTLANSTFDIRLFDITVPGINGTFTTTFANNTGTTLQVLGNNGTGHVPEPSSVALAALAFAGLVACGLRRHRRKI